MDLRVLEICKQRKITQKDLAERIGLSAVGLTKAINGNPTKDTLERIATALEVPITDLFERPASNVITCPKCGAVLQVNEKQ